LAQALEQAMMSNDGYAVVDEGTTQPPPEQLWYNVAHLLRYGQLLLFAAQC